MLGPMKIQANQPPVFHHRQLPKPAAPQEPVDGFRAAQDLEKTYRNYTVGGAALGALGAGLAAGMNGLHTGLIGAATGAFVGAFFGNIYCHFTQDGF